MRDPVGVLSRVGYLSEDRDLPDWMRIGELLRYLRAFYPGWDDAFAEGLREQFDLDPAARIKGLSQGQRAAGRPARGAGLPARAAGPRRALDGARPDRPPRHPGGDHPDDRRGGADGPLLVAPARRGRAGRRPGGDDRPRAGSCSCGPLDEVKAAHRRLTLRFDEPRSQPRRLAGSLACEGFGREWTAVCRGSVEQIAGEAAGPGRRIVDDHVPSLDEIFVARVRSRESVPVEG